MYQWAKSADVDQTGKPQELKKPIEYYVALYAANDPTDYFVEDASFVKLREVSPATGSVAARCHGSRASGRPAPRSR
jgi:hypothetical protein